jgi:hypothetical protein
MIRTFTMEQAPSIGRIVHYVLTEGTHKGEHRPAIVLRCEEQKIDVHVFTLGIHDGIDANPLIVFSVYFDSTGTVPRSWHWPERV